MTPARVRQLVRRVTLGLALGGVVYLFLRFEALRLPATGTSPLLRYSPGSLLVVDAWARAYRPGDAALVRHAAGVALLPLGEARGDGFAVDRQEGDPERTEAWPPVIEREDLRGRVVLALRP